MKRQPQGSHKFASKWSRAIEEHGFTAIPNLLLYQRKSLGITIPELCVIICIESFRWDEREPYPGLKTLSTRVRLSTRTTRKHLSCLEGKGLIKRIYRTGQTNKYKIQPLVDALDRIAVSTLPPGRREPPRFDKTNLSLRSESSSKEDLVKQDSKSRPTNKNVGISSLGEIAQRKYGRPP